MGAEIVTLPNRPMARHCCPTDPDAELKYAVEQYIRTVDYWNRSRRVTDEMAARLHRIRDAWEDRVLESDPATIGGLAAKLRYTLAEYSDNPRMCHYLLTRTVPNEERDDFNLQEAMLWELSLLAEQLAR